MVSLPQLISFFVITIALPLAQAKVHSHPQDSQVNGTLASQDVFDELQRAANLSSAAYSGCGDQAFDVMITMQINNALTDTQGYVGFSPSKQRITVAIRGSTTMQDLANDVNTKLVTPTLSGVNFPTGVKVMQGISDPWASVHDQVVTEVKRLVGQNPDFAIESTGHSLGGSLTYMSFIALAQNFPGKNVTSNALAAYPIGNAAFAAFGASQNGTLRRGDNVADGVPNLYPQFTHFGTEFFGAGNASTTIQCNGERDPACSAGDGEVGVSAGHFSSFGERLGFVGCGGGVPGNGKGIVGSNGEGFMGTGNVTLGNGTVVTVASSRAANMIKSPHAAWAIPFGAAMLGLVIL